MRDQLRKILFTPIDGSSLALFRIGFGAIMLLDILRYWKNGWIDSAYVEPLLHFKYYGFSWVQTPQGTGMYWLVAIIALSSLCVALGLFYRIAIIVFSASFGYFFLLDQAQYLNHFYMVILFALSLCVLPANRVWSLDQRLFKFRSGNIPYWCIWLLRVQVEIILVYAGLVKLNPDWLQLQPLAGWLARRADMPLFGDLFVQSWAVAIAAYGVIALHLIGAPLLFWRKTRIYVFSLYAVFHTLNHFVFTIGIFPWFTLFASLLFFSADWPRRWLGPPRSDREEVLAPPPTTRQNLIVALLSVWVGFQLLFPARHWLYPGNVAWTEQGHRFAWRMKLRDKIAETTFFIKDASLNTEVTIDPRLYLTRRQYRKMSSRPDMILQFAHYLRDHEAAKYHIDQPKVYVDAWASLNFRQPARLIDPQRDLATVTRNLWSANWILPLPRQ